jgi:hypothetical protein
MAFQLPRCTSTVGNKAGKGPSPALAPLASPLSAAISSSRRTTGQQASQLRRQQLLAAGASAGTSPSIQRAGSSSVVCRSTLGVFSGGEIVEVEELKGIRVTKGENELPMVEYLVKWQDGSPDTW